MTRAAAAPALRIPIGTAAPVSQPDMSPNRRRDRASDRGARAACATATGCRQVVALLRKSGAAAAARCAAPTSVPFATHLRRSGGVHRTARGRRGRPCRVLYRASRQGRARLRPRAGDSSCLRCNPRLPISLRCSMIRRLRCRSRRASSRALSSSWWSLRREILSVLLQVYTWISVALFGAVVAQGTASSCSLVRAVGVAVAAEHEFDDQERPGRRATGPQERRRIASSALCAISTFFLRWLPERYMSSAARAVLVRPARAVA